MAEDNKTNSTNQNTGASTPPVTPPAASDQLVNGASASQTPPDSTTTPPVTPSVAPQTASSGKVSITYIGGGVWKDSDGKKWSAVDDDGNITTLTLTDKEYAKREDIKFMVGYGAMKMVTI